MFTPLTEAIAELALWENRPRDANDTMVETLARLPLDRAFYMTRLGPVLALAIRIQADLAVIARAHGDPSALQVASDAAEADLDAMRQFRDQAHADRPNFVSQADAWCSLCEAEFTRLSGEAEPGVWSIAAAGFEVIPMHDPRAYALWRAAEASLAAGRKRSEATAWLREANVLAVALGADPLLQQIRTLASRAHIDLEVEQPAEPDLPSHHNAIGLTRRELEVLRLIAAGDSNRQIAERLFITEGTAGTHVSNIIGKLGARGRTEAAAIAHRLSLVD
jgi:DNA-binding CsgD family transcriptional regulator